MGSRRRRRLVGFVSATSTRLSVLQPHRPVTVSRYPIVRQSQTFFVLWNGWIDERRNQVGSAATSCVNLPFSFADDFTVPFTFLPALSSALLTPPHCGRTDTTRASSTFSPGGWLRRRRRRRRARDPATTIGAGRITFTTRASERGRASENPLILP